MKVDPVPSVLRHVPALHGGRYSVKEADHATIDFSSNITPLGTPKSVRRAIRQSIGSIAEYPDADSPALLSDLGEYAGLPADNLVAGNGAVEIIYNFCHAFLSPKTRVLMPVPTFSEYEAASRLYNARISYFDTMNLSDSIDEFLAKIPDRGCVFLCNPNNPTGSLLSKNDVLSVARRACQASSLVLLDECFIEMAESGESVIGCVREHENLVVLRSLTKAFGMPGIRIGYAAAPVRVAEILRRVRVPWGVNSLAQAAARAAIADTSHLAKSRKIIQRESAYLRRNISRLEGFECLESSANFILIRTTRDSGTLQKALLARGILVRDCSSFRGLDSHYIRIAVRSRLDNRRLVLALEAVQ